MLSCPYCLWLLVFGCTRHADARYAAAANSQVLLIARTF
jgi:hypothetical protein